jgi:hypothetical protein
MGPNNVCTAFCVLVQGRHPAHASEETYKALQVPTKAEALVGVACLHSGLVQGRHLVAVGRVHGRARCQQRRHSLRLALRRAPSVSRAAQPPLCGGAARCPAVGLMVYLQRSQ